MTRHVRRPPPEDSNKPTIYSLARDLGISASTVSRALTRPQMVRQAVRERILSEADRQGYRTNRAARGLATGTTGLIGVAVFDVANPFVPPLIRAIDKAADAGEQSLLLLDMDRRAPLDAAALRRLSGQVDGLIISSPQMTVEDLIDAIDGTATVLINREAPGLSSVVCDNTDALWEAAEYLVACGHRRFLVLPGPRGSWAAERRTGALREWGLRAMDGVTLSELDPTGATFSAGRDAVTAIVESGATAIFAFDDLVASGIISGLAEAGLRVPGDFSVVGCDDVLLARTLTPQLTTVAAPFEMLGTSSVHILSQVMNGEATVQEKLVGTFVARGTTGTSPKRDEVATGAS